MPQNEAETRKQIIDKMLACAGWDVDDKSLVTEELDIKRKDIKVRASI